jgi:subtilisin-like proprotein convertase family protein
LINNIFGNIMNKLLILLLIFAVTSAGKASDKFFYSNGKKLILHEDESYIAVRFKDDLTDANKNFIISETCRGTLESSINFTYSRSNGTRVKYNLIKLKSNSGDMPADEVINKLLKLEQVDYAGTAYLFNDKVIHFPTNELIVKFKNDISSFSINNLCRLFNSEIIEKINSFDNAYVVGIKSKGNQGNDNIFDISNKFSLTPFVEFSQPDFIRIGMLTTPNDTLISRMWNIHNTGTNVPEGIPGVPGCDLRVDTAWNFVTGNQKVLIAIIDTGTDTTHYDLINNLCDRQLWYNPVDENQYPQDGYGHGTPMCGIAAATGNNIAGTAGVAFNCKIMPIRVFSNEGLTTDLILGKGLNWAWMHGADVLNNSWGGGVPSPFIEHAIKNAVHFGRNGKGSVVFAATGNDNNDTIIFPSSMPEVIAVGGVSPCNQRKSPTSCDGENWGANYGDNLSVVSPTPKIGCTSLGGGWAFWCNGTSSACPQATAIGALILTKNINLSADSVRIIIEKTARKIGNYSYSTSKPNGLWNNEMGYGMINALGCIQMTPQGPDLIYDQTPPVIKVKSPQIKKYFNNIIVTADIYDNEMLAGGTGAPRLYYTSSYSSGLNSVLGIKGSGNSFSFTLLAFAYGTSINYYIAAQDTSSNHNITTYPYGGLGLNPPGSIPPPKKIHIQNTETFDLYYTSIDVPKPISQLKETTFVSILNNPVNNTVLGVTCTINVSHSYDADLSFSLISPAGTEIVLTTGTGKDGDGYTNTTFDDYSELSIEDTNNRAPYTGSYKPIENLWMFNGENSQGNWLLKVVDNGFGDGGALNGWSASFKYSSYNDLSLIPAKFELINNYPNPFNPSTRIFFNVARRTNVKIILYDLTGREVARILDDTRDAKFRDYVDFNSSSVNGGKGISSGVYFYSMIAEDKFIEARKMVLIK